MHQEMLIFAACFCGEAFSSNECPLVSNKSIKLATVTRIYIS